MYKKNYLQILCTVADKTDHDGKFDFDRALDGSYGFNVNEASKLFELVHIVETIASSKDMLKCSMQGDTLLKEFKYQFGGRIYQVSRYYSNDENTYIRDISSSGSTDYVPEKDLMIRIDEKCELITHILNKAYEERASLLHKS